MGNDKTHKTYLSPTALSETRSLQVGGTGRIQLSQRRCLKCSTRVTMPPVAAKMHPPLEEIPEGKRSSYRSHKVVMEVHHDMEMEETHRAEGQSIGLVVMEELVDQEDPVDQEELADLEDLVAMEGWWT